MKSAQPKVLHRLAGQALAERVVKSARQFSSDITMVVGHGAEQVRQYFANSDIKFCEQAEQLGTGHAVLQALPMLPNSGLVLILYGDVPLIQTSTLRALADAVSERSIGLLTVKLADPTGYGRIVRGQDGKVKKIVEEKDANPAERAITEVNSGIIAVPAALLQRWLPTLSADNAQGEYYLTDLTAIAVAEGVPVTTVQPAYPQETWGINSRQQLAELERWWQWQQAQALMAQGVTLYDPARLDIRGTLSAGQDCIIDVNCIFGGDVSLGSEVTIGANCVIEDSTLAAGTVIEPNCVIKGAIIGRKVTVGPFARIRPGSQLAEQSKVGNFVETKNSKIGAGTKVSHLSYVGDSLLGEHANIGAGTITCNYDGANKHQTIIGDNAFIGSNTTLVAPVTVAEEAFIGAGSVITKNAPAAALTVGRARQVTLNQWQKPEKKSP